jgi:hypothetical protein
MRSYWRPEVLSEIVRHLKRGELYLFAGAGLSRLAGYPSWEELLKQFAEAYRILPTHRTEIETELNALIEKRDLAIITHLILLGQQGEDAFMNVLTKTFGPPDRTSNAHRMLIGLPFAGFITINYDRCFEIAAEENKEANELTSERWFCYPKHRAANNIQLDKLNTGRRFLLHMHGCLYHNRIIDSKNIILTKQQYRQFYGTPEMNWIYNQFMSKPMLLLGTSFGDRNILQQLYECRGHHDRDIRSQRGKFYLVIPQSEKSDIEHSQSEEYGVEFNYFDRDDSSAIESMVKELRNACEETTVRLTPEEEEMV